MIRKLTAMLAAVALAATIFAPGTAVARDRHDYRGNYHNNYHGGYGRHYRRGDHDDAVAAGVVGLVLGLALGAAASSDNQPRGRCYNNYQRCSAPPSCGGCYNQGYYDQGYYDRGGYDPRYDPRYERGSAYERDYAEGGPPPGYYDQGYGAPPQCFRRERQWDRYAGRYVSVEVPC